MARCEDFPCCGHETGDCPDRDRSGRETYRCVECRGRLPRTARSSICAKCQRKASQYEARHGESYYDRFDN